MLIDIYVITVNAIGAYQFSQGDFYFYETGELTTGSLTKFVMLIFTMFPKFGGIFFNPVDPWQRYEGLTGL